MWCGDGEIEEERFLTVALFVDIIHAVAYDIRQAVLRLKIGACHSVAYQFDSFLWTDGTVGKSGHLVVFYINVWSCAQRCWYAVEIVKSSLCRSVFDGL